MMPPRRRSSAPPSQVAPRRVTSRRSQPSRATNQAGQEQAHPRHRGVGDHRRLQRVQVAQQVGRVFSGDGRAFAAGAQVPGQQQGHRQGQGDVAENGHALGARHGPEHGAQTIALPAAAPVGFIHRGRQGGGGHRRLLGGDGEAEQVDEHETQAVVEAIGQGLHGGRQALVVQQDLAEGEHADDGAATQRRQCHGGQLFAVTRDVVLPGLAGVLGHAQGQHPGGFAQIVAHAVPAHAVAQRDGDETRPGIDGAWQAAGVHLVEQQDQQFQAIQALAQTPQQQGQGQGGALLPGACQGVAHHGLAGGQALQRRRSFAPAAQPGVQFPGQCEEGAFLMRFARVQPARFRMLAPDRAAAGEQARRLGLACMNAGQAGRGKGCGGADAQPEFLPGLLLQQGQPARIQGFAEDAAQGGDEVRFVAHLRQQVIADAAQQLIRETAVRQDARLGIEGQGVVAGEQLRDQLSQALQQLRARIQQVEQVSGRKRDGRS